MRCGQCKELLSVYIEGDLAESQRAVLQSHLRECSECRQTLLRMKATLAVVRNLPQEPWSNRFDQQLTAWLARETKRAQPTPRKTVTIPAVALVCLGLFLLGFGTLQLYQRRSVTTTGSFIAADDPSGLASEKLNRFAESDPQGLTWPAIRGGDSLRWQGQIRSGLDLYRSPWSRPNAFVESRRWLSNAARSTSGFYGPIEILAKPELDQMNYMLPVIPTQLRSTYVSF